MHDAFFILASTWHYSLKRNDIWHYSLDKHVACQLTYIQSPRGGGHSIVKLNTTCKTSLLPLYYMAWIILNFMIFFYIYITIDNIFCIFLKFLAIVICLVQFCIILVRNGMFCYKNGSSNLVMNFYYVIDIIYTYSLKKSIIYLFLWCNLEKVDVFVSHMVFYLTMECIPRVFDILLSLNKKINPQTLRFG